MQVNDNDVSLKRIAQIVVFNSLSRFKHSVHIRELRCIRPYLDFRTASTIATSIVHSKLDYCNSLYYNLPQSQIKDSRTSRTLLLVLSPEHQNLLTSLLFLNLYTGSK